MKILVTIKLPKPLEDRICDVYEIDIVKEDRPMPRDLLLEQIRDKDGLLCKVGDRIDAHLLDHAPKLKIISNFGAGYDHIDLDAASRCGIPVAHTPGAVTAPTADITMALILATARRVVEGDKRNRAGRASQGGLFHFLGCEVTGKTLGIVGLGRIGKAVAKRASGFDMPLIYHSRSRLKPSQEHEFGVRFVPFETLMAEADFVSLHVPLTHKTHHLINRDALSLMKPDAILINTARGPVVDEKALLIALQKNKIGGVGLDVYENETVVEQGLAKLENTVLLPHVGSATFESRMRMAEMAVDNLLIGLDESKPPNCLNCAKL